MWLQVYPQSEIPMYKQIIDGVKAAIAKRYLRPGDKLPTVRDLATQLTMNHNTVAKAYQELEREGVIELVRGRGTFVAKNVSVPHQLERMEALRDAMRKIIVEAHHLNLSETDLLDMFQAVLSDWTGEQAEVYADADEPGGR